MKHSLLTAFVLAATLLGATRTETATAQNAILAEMYGRGVHAYYAGNHTDAYQLLSMAIDNGIQDPRAYYFRGMVAHATGRSYEAEADWRQGAEMEASGRTNPAVGRSLARFQGSARIKLEGMRQQAKLQALADALSRSKQRYGELGAIPGAADVAPPAPSVVPSPTAPAAPAVPPAAGGDPFADDMAQGQPKVDADDALEGAMNDPFANDAAAAGAAAPAAGDANPFGGDAGGADDPFGGGGDAGADPFGGGGDAGMEDPFGGGGDSGGADDPFGGNPFGN